MTSPSTESADIEQWRWLTTPVELRRRITTHGLPAGRPAWVLRSRPAAYPLLARAEDNWRGRGQWLRIPDGEGGALTVFCEEDAP